MIMLKKSLFFVFLLLIALIPLGTCTPSDEGFSHYVTISLDHDDVDATLTDFPVLIHLSDSCGINSFDATAIFEEIGDQYNYSAFEDTDENRLFFEVEYWSSSDVEAFIWVKIPSISADSDTEIIFWFEKFVDGSEYNSPSDVWGSDFVMVQHMNDETTSTILDSTSNDNDGTKKAANEPIEAAGKIGKAQTFDAIDDYVTFGRPATLNVTDNLTLEAIIKTSDIVTQIQRIINSELSYELFILTDGNIQVELNNVNNFVTATTPIISTLNYYYIVATYDKSLGSNRCKIYVNGAIEFQGDPFTDSINALSANVELGARFAGTNQQLKGISDENKISNSTRSSAWVGASYETQRDHFCSFGSITLYVADVPSRGEFLAAGMILALIVVPLFIFVMFALRRRR